MPDLGGMKTTTLRHMAQRKGISLHSFSSHKFSTAGDAQEMADRPSGSSLLKCSLRPLHLVTTWTSSFPGTWSIHLSFSKVKGASFYLVNASGPLFLQEESQRKNFSLSWPQDINNKINNKVETLLDMMPGIRCVHSKQICSLLQDGFLLLYFKYWSRIIECTHDLCSWLWWGYDISQKEENLLPQLKVKDKSVWDFPGDPWLRIPQPMQGTWVQSLFWEDSTCCGATKPMCHNCWAPRVQEPQPSKPEHLTSVFHTREATTVRSLSTATWSPSLSQLEKTWVQQQRPSAAKNKYTFFKKMNFLIKKKKKT